MKYCMTCKRYSIDKICSICSNKTVLKEPPRFSPQDKYGKYRRMLKRGNTHGKNKN